MKFTGSFGTWLKQRRKALDLTQRELADQVGCALATIHKIEADVRRPSKQIVERIADVLAIMPDERTTFMSFARQVTNHVSAQSAFLEVPEPSSNFPAYSTSFFGRETELAQIKERLADPGCRLLTLVGVGGIGKTRLAVQAAENCIDDFADGVYFVSLAPVGSSALIAAAIANVLQISFQGQQEPNRQLTSYLRAKHMLLVIDNYEHLLDGVGLLTDSLAAAPQLKILVTSRVLLNLHEEWVLPIEGLLYPAPSSSDDVGSYSGVQLFVQTARRLQPNFSLEGNQESVIDICRAVEGMPLGIELAASWLRAMPCHEIGGQIRRSLDFLATPLRNIPDRHRSLRGVFEHSWGLLSEGEQAALMKLSVFRGGITAEAAAQVAQAPIRLLAGLVDKSLLRLNIVGRYDMHELVRQFAADKLQESDETTTTQNEHAQYFLGLAEQIEQRLFGPQHVVLLDRLEAEHDNFRAVLNWVLQIGEAELGLRLAGALGWFWNRRTYWREGRIWLEKFLEIGTTTSLSVQAKAAHHLLEINNDSHNWKPMAVLYEVWIAQVHAVENTRVKAWLLTSLGYAGMRLLKPELEYLNEALALFTTMDDQWGIGETLSRLSGAWNDRGDFDRSSELMQAGIRLMRLAGDKSVLSWMLFNSANHNWNRGKMDAPTELIIQESLTLFQELGYKHGIHLLLCQWGHIAHFRRDEDRAKSLFQQSLVISQQMNGGFYVPETLLGIAEIYCIQSEPERGATLLGAIAETMRLELAAKSQFDNRPGIDFERAVATACNHLNVESFNAAFAKGQTMTLDRAVAYALADSIDQSITTKTAAI